MNSVIREKERRVSRKLPYMEGLTQHSGARGISISILKTAVYRRIWIGNRYIGEIKEMNEPHGLHRDSQSNNKHRKVLQ
jgi:hypothetical protein